MQQTRNAHYVGGIPTQRTHVRCGRPLTKVVFLCVLVATGSSLPLQIWFVVENCECERHFVCRLSPKLVRCRAKYPLAISRKLLDSVGSDLGVGYDIGCAFGATLRKSSLGDDARKQNLCFFCGAFHGYCHESMDRPTGPRFQRDGGTRTATRIKRTAY